MKKIALVGCGRISNRHIDAIQGIEGAQIALLCDNDYDKAKSASEKLKIPFVTDYKEIKNIDIVSILTPSGNHPSHVIEIAENTEVPIIVCEKPVSLTVREAYELFSQVDKSGKRLIPVYQNRYNPLVVLLKELIDSGRLGKIYNFNSNVFWNRNDEYYDIDWHGSKELDGGVLYTQASHYIDMIHYFFGQLSECKGLGGSLRELEVFDTVSAVCKFKSGVIGSINATVNVYRTNYLTEFTIIAERGTIRLSGTNLNKIDFWDVKGIEKPDMDFDITHQYGKGHNTMYKYIIEENWDKFPSKEEILSGISLMEKLSN